MIIQEFTWEDFLKNSAKLLMKKAYSEQAVQELGRHNLILGKQLTVKDLMELVRNQ